MTEQQLYSPDQVISEMLRKVAQGEDVSGQAYLDMLGEHAKELAARMNALSENEIDDTVGEVLGELADGNSYELGEFDAPPGQGLSSEGVKSRLLQLADELWKNNPQAGMQPV